MENLRSKIELLDNILDELLELNLSSYLDDTYDNENELHEKAVETIENLKTIYEIKLKEKEKNSLIAV